MYRCISDYHKLLVCNYLPMDVSENIFSQVEAEIQHESRCKKNEMLCELTRNERFIYLRLIHEMFEKFGKAPNTLREIANSVQDTPDDLFITYYLRCIAFDIEIYNSETNEEDRWVYLKRMVLSTKRKQELVNAMKIVLT